ncbi:MAG: DUF6265 family protein [Acidobacteria bacterium]|nr:DUF6265 family protein [Acidobacteriota bacterium]
MKKSNAVSALFLLFFLIIAVSNFNAQKIVEEKPLQVISWLEGKWVKAYGDKWREEHWSFMGGSFLGMCREIENSSSNLIEVMVIAQEETNTIMRVRRFSNNLKIALDEKDKTALFKLNEYNKKMALFQGIGENQGEEITYKLLTKDLLEITVDYLHNGEKKTEIYRMKRI